MDKKEREQLFKKHFSENILKPLKALGFKRYTPKSMGRIVGDSIFQFFDLQKDANGTPRFTVNIACRPLYVSDDIVSLSPGDRLGVFKSGRDMWWGFGTQEEAEASFKEVYQAIIEHVMPWYEDMGSTHGMLQEFYSKKHGIRWQPSKQWLYYDLGFMHMRVGQYEKATECFNLADQSFTKSDQVRGIISDALLAISNGDVAVDAFLKECERGTRAVYRLEKW